MDNCCGHKTRGFTKGAESFPQHEAIQPSNPYNPDVYVYIYIYDIMQGTGRNKWSPLVDVRRKGKKYHDDADDNGEGEKKTQQ